MGEMSRDQKVALAFCYTGYYFTCVCISVPSPFLPMQCELHGLGSATTGIMLGLVSFVQCFMNFVWGRLMMRIGVHNILTYGMAMAAITVAGFGFIEFIPNHSSTAFAASGFSIRILQAVGTSAVFTATMTFVAEMFPAHSTLMLSILGTLGGVGMISGPAIGSGLFKVGGFWLVFVGIGGIMLLLSITMGIWLPKLVKSQRDTTDQLEGHDTVDQPEGSVPYKKILLNARMLIALSIAMFSSAKWAAIDPILEPELRNRYGLNQEKSALVFLLLSGTYVLVTPIAGKTVGKPYCLDSLLIMLIGLVIATAAFLFAGPSTLLGLEYNSLWLLLVCLSVMGLTNCLLYVPAQDITFNIERLNLAPDVNKTAVRGFISGIWNTFYSLGNALGMISSGSLTQLTSWSMTMTVYAAACIIFIIIITVIKLEEALALHLSHRCCHRKATRRFTHHININEDDVGNLIQPEI